MQNLDLKGTIEPEVSIFGSIQKEDSIVGTLNIPTGYEDYKGPYTVVPKVDEEIILDTKNKVAKNNITVEKIPIETVENPHGGLTLWIGGKLNE